MLNNISWLILAGIVGYLIGRYYWGTYLTTKYINKYSEIHKKYYNTEMSLAFAIYLLKQCVNYDNEPMTTAISGELGDRIREFIGRCENA